MSCHWFIIVFYCTYESFQKKFVVWTTGFEIDSKYMQSISPSMFMRVCVSFMCPRGAFQYKPNRTRSYVNNVYNNSLQHLERKQTNKKKKNRSDSRKTLNVLNTAWVWMLTESLIQELKIWVPFYPTLKYNIPPMENDQNIRS